MRKRTAHRIQQAAHNTFLSLLLLGMTLSASAVFAQDGNVEILHAPIKVGLDGQNIAIRARVQGGNPPAKKVSLLWAPSRDAAPYRIVMQDTGTGIYAASIAADLFAGLKEIFYYLEAATDDGVAAETAWYTVDIRPLAPRRSTPSRKPTTVRATPPTPVTRTAKPSGERRWVKPTLIGAGVLAAGAGVYALTEDGGGGGSSSGSGTTGPTSDIAGTYSGSATTCFQPTGSNIVCSTESVTFTIDDDGLVTTSDLGDGSTIGARISGTSFVFAVPSEDGDFTGEIQYLGTVIDNRIVGTTQGSASTPGGETGAYSGAFSANR